MIIASANASNSQNNFASLTSGTTAEIINHINVMHSLLLAAGVSTRPTTPKAVATLISFDEAKQLQVLENAKKLIGVLNSVKLEISSETENEIEGGVNEVALVKRALDIFGFKIKDGTWEQKARNHIIEIYNNQGVQLHRSLNFFKTCGYSLLDLCVNEWYVLWERPRRAMKQMDHVVSMVLSGTYNEVKIPIDPHIVRETYDDGTTQPFLPRSMHVEFGDIYPTYNAANEISGFVVTTQANLLSVGDDALKLSFI